MSAIDSYTNHLRMLNEVKQQLSALKRYMIEMREKYKRQIDVAESTGFMQDYTNQLKEKYQRFSQKVDDITSLMQRHDSQIAQQEAVIQRLIEVARNI